MTTPPFLSKIAPLPADQQQARRHCSQDSDSKERTENRDGGRSLGCVRLGQRRRPIGSNGELTMRATNLTVPRAHKSSHNGTRLQHGPCVYVDDPTTFHTL